MKTNIKLITVLFAITVFSCKKKTAEVDPSAYKVNSIPATTDAKLLLILNDDPLGNTNNSQLVKITGADQVLPISISDNSGGDVSGKFRSGQLSNANPDFMLITFSRLNGGVATEGYLMKKTDGSLISVNDYGVPIVSKFSSLNYPFTYYNGSSYIYTIAGDNTTLAKIIRISTTNPNFVTTEKITSDTIRNILGFEVDANNNIMSSLNSIKGKSYLLAFNSNNATIITNGGSRSYWLNSNGDLSFNAFDGYIKKATSDGSSSPFVVSNDVNLAANGINSQLYKDLSYRVSYNNKFVMVSDSRIFELDNAAHKPKEITTVPVFNQKWIDHSQTNGLIFIAGENASGQQTIFRIDLANNYAYTTYPAAGKYNFYEIEAFEDGTIYATAKRNSDGKSVILKFAPNGTETLLDDTMNRKGIWLEKVTEFTN